ncbi:hypothetical protein HDU82_007918 [Entophlyctis luteolus]|nr:hypothetical protein HDU82_007918 [Entophlyctis luteolus]
MLPPEIVARIALFLRAADVMAVAQSMRSFRAALGHIPRAAMAVAGALQVKIDSVWPVFVFPITRLASDASVCVSADVPVRHIVKVSTLVRCIDVYADAAGSIAPRTISFLDNARHILPARLHVRLPNPVKTPGASTSLQLLLKLADIFAERCSVPTTSSPAAAAGTATATAATTGIDAASTSSGSSCCVASLALFHDPRVPDADVMHALTRLCAVTARGGGIHQLSVSCKWAAAAEAAARVLTDTPDDGGGAGADAAGADNFKATSDTTARWTAAPPPPPPPHRVLELHKCRAAFPIAAVLARARGALHTLRVMDFGRHGILTRKEILFAEALFADAMRVPHGSASTAAAAALRCVQVNCAYPNVLANVRSIAAQNVDPAVWTMDVRGPLSVFFTRNLRAAEM